MSYSFKFEPIKVEPVKIEPIKIELPKIDPYYSDQSMWNTLYGCHHLLGPAYPPKSLPLSPTYCIEPLKPMLF